MNTICLLSRVAHCNTCITTVILNSSFNIKLEVWKIVHFINIHIYENAPLTTGIFMLLYLYTNVHLKLANFMYIMHKKYFLKGTP